jgi:hypothetical protein
MALSWQLFHETAHLTSYLKMSVLDENSATRPYMARRIDLEFDNCEIPALIFHIEIP